MRKIIVLLLVISLTLSCCMTVNADSGEKKNGLFSYKLKGNGTAVITGFNWRESGSNDIYIPRQIDGYTVTELGEYSFSNENASLEKPVGSSVVVIIPDTVTIIGNKTFFCTNINTVAIPSSVQLIGAGAFAGCKNIQDHFVDSNNETFTTISGVLYNKKTKELVSYSKGLISSEQFEIPNGILSIGDYAFYGVTIKDNISIPSTVTKIGKSAFEYAEMNSQHSSEKKRDGVFSFGGVKEIGDYAFANVKLNHMAFLFSSSKIESIGDYAFSNVSLAEKTRHSSTSEKWDIVFPSSLINLGEGAFQNYLKSKDRMRHSWGIDIGIIDLSQTRLTAISDYAFDNAGLDRGEERDRQTIHTILLPETLVHIGKYAFSHIGYLDPYMYEVKLTIPASVQIIDEYAFWLAGLGLSFDDESKIRNIEDNAFYRAAIWVNDDNLQLPNGLQSIGERSLDCQVVSTISIPASVSAIGNDFCNRSDKKLKVESGTYAAIYASENGYITISDEDTSWLSN